MITGTPLAVGFPEPVMPPTHVPDWRLFNDETAQVACLRCRQMIDVKQWAGERCPGEPKETP